MSDKPPHFDEYLSIVNTLAMEAASLGVLQREELFQRFSEDLKSSLAAKGHDPALAKEQVDTVVGLARTALSIIAQGGGQSGGTA